MSPVGTAHDNNHNKSDSRVADPPATIPTAKFLERLQDHCSPSPTHDYFGRTHTMAPEPRAPDRDRPTGPSRARSAVENLLPAGIVRRGRSRPPATPHMERSISALADSFVDYWGVASRNPPDLDGTVSPDPAALKDDALTPISNWAHLNYMKTQRNTLRAELKAHQVAGADAKRSVASLRRLALRMAVNISVKERQIATSARNLATSRKSSYLEGKDAEKRVEELRRALRVEEGRNKEILEALERASMLTLQYASPTEAQRRRPRNPLSPPPSPPTRLANLSMTTLSDPQTPPRSTSSSWNETDWELTPAIESPTDIRTSDSRLIRAKRESDEALSACRRRINELQAECAKSKEDSKALQASKSALEKDIEEHQARIASLEKARIQVEETLESTRLQLEVSTGLEDGLKQRLRLKNKELAALEQGSGDKQQEIEALQDEKAMYTKELKARDDELKQLESRVAQLEDNSITLQGKLDAAERDEVSLREQLKMRQTETEELQSRLDRGSKYEHILQKKIAEHEQEILGNVKRIETGGNLISSLRDQLQQSEGSKRNIEEALATLRTEVTTLGANRDTVLEARDRMSAELAALQNAKAKMHEELRCAASALEHEKNDKARLQSELHAIQSSQNAAHANLQAAQSHIKTLERTGSIAQADFELLHDEKAAVEADLKDARQTLFALREIERMNRSELSELQASEKTYERRLQEFKERQSALEIELEQARSAQLAGDRHREEELRRHNEQHRELQLSVASLQATLQASEQLKASLQAQLKQFQESKNGSDEQLNGALRSRDSLRTELATALSRMEHIASESAGLKTRVTDLEASLSASQQSRVGIEARLSSVHDERGQLKTLISELELALKDSRDAKCKVEESLRIVQLDGEASGAEVAEVADLHERLSEAQESKEEAENKLREAVAARTVTEDDLQSARARLAMVEAEASRMGSEFSTLQAEVAKAQHSKQEMEERLHTSQSAWSELKDQMQSTEARLQSVEAEVAILASKLMAREEDLAKAYQGSAEVQSKLEASRIFQTKLEDDLSTTHQTKKEIEDRLQDVLGAHAELENDLMMTRSKLTEMEAERSASTSRLKDADVELSALRQSKKDAERKLQDALACTAALEDDLVSAQSRCESLRVQHVELTSMLNGTQLELTNAREQKADIDKHAEDLIAIRSLLAGVEAEKAELTAQLAAKSHETIRLQETNTKLMEQYQDATQRASDLEHDLHDARSVADTEVAAMRSRVMEVDGQISGLREANAKLTATETEMASRLESAEEELQIVRDTNKRLEAFLERVEEDMTQAETAFEQSEKRLEEFVDESQAKLDAARNAKLKYKRRLSEKNNEIGVLTDVNSSLHHQVDQQSRQLDELAQGRTELIQQLSAKEKFVTELKSSSDKRMRSMNSAYNDLRSKYEKQLREQHEDSENRLRTELQAKDVTIGGLQDHKDQSSPSSAALQKEVEALREDKKAFERLVATLKEKVHQLETLREWQEPAEETEEDDVATSSKPGPSRPAPKYIPSSTSSMHTRSSRATSVLSRPASIGHPSLLNERPTTRASTTSKQEDLDAWAKEIERIRLLRDEQAIQLKDNKKARNDLRKSLKDSKSQLHQLEKQKKPHRHRTLLRKNRPSTGLHTSAAMGTDGPFSPPTTPSRPATSAGMFASPDTARSRHTIHFSPDTYLDPTVSPGALERPMTSSPISSSKRWSLHRPKSSHRPLTSAGLAEVSTERPTTSAGERGTHEPKDKRKWSSSLRKLFN